MKKWGILAVAIVVVLLIAGGVYLFTAKKPAMAPSPKTAKPTNASIFSSIQDALNRSLSLKCTYSSGDIETVAYLKNGEIRSDFTSAKNPQANGSVIMIMKSKKMYYWNAQHMGFMMQIPDITVTPTGPLPTSTSAQNTLNDLEKYKQHCQTATVADSLFILPTDVTFKDMSQIVKAMPSVVVPSGSPTGYSIPTQYQQYMQK